MHVRRALLLFAIVLGLAALTASLSRPGEEDPEAPDGAQQRADHASRVAGSCPSPPEELAFDAAEDDVLELDEGRPATLEVSVDEAGQVEIPLLGLSASAEPLTPARFDVLPSESGRYELTFTPAAGDESRPAGTLDVVPRRVRRLGAAALVAAGLLAAGCADDEAAPAVERTAPPEPRTTRAERRARACGRCAAALESGCRSASGASSTWSGWTPTATATLTSCSPRRTRSRRPASP